MDGWLYGGWFVGRVGDLILLPLCTRVVCFLFLGEEDLRARLLATFLILPPEQDRVWVLYWVALLE
jgi:hypothetical protein